MVQLPKDLALATMKLTNEYRLLLRTHGVRLSVPALNRSVCVTILTTCVSSPIVIAPDCLELIPIFAHLSKGESPATQSYSKKVRGFFKESQRNTTPWRRFTMNKKRIPKLPTTSIVSDLVG